MELTVIGISGTIAVVVAGLEGMRQLHKGVGSVGIRSWLRPPLVGTVALAVGMTVVVSLAVWGITADPLQGLLVLLGGIWGIGCWGSSLLGRAAQGIAVLAACLWTSLLPGEVPVLQQLAALGLGLGLTGVPVALALPSAMSLSLFTALAQGWLLIAASTWGLRLADLMQGETGWYRVLPCGLAALALVGGTVPLLVADPGDRELESDQPGERAQDHHQPRSSHRALWIGRIIGGIVASGLGGILVRNWLHQDLFYPVAFGIGVILSLILMALEEGQADHDPTEEAPDPAQKLQQGILSLAVVGGGALLALRLGGSYGAAVIGLGLLTFPNRWGVTAALFLGARPLVQSLLYEFDLNLTGINITHAYTYAALFLGIAGVGIAAVVGWIYRGRRITGVAVGLPCGSVVLTALTGYFIHLRPQMSLVLGALMTALVIAALEPVVIGAGVRSSSSSRDVQDLPWWGWGPQGLALVMLAILTAVVTRDLTLMGAEATRIERLWVLAGVLGTGAVILGVGAGVFRGEGRGSDDSRGRI